MPGYMAGEGMLHLRFDRRIIERLPTSRRPPRSAKKFHVTLSMISSTRVYCDVTNNVRNIEIRFVFLFITYVEFKIAGEFFTRAGEIANAGPMRTNLKPKLRWSLQGGLATMVPSTIKFNTIPKNTLS